MDEKGANTFPFHNLPPELKKTSLKVFPVLFSVSFWIKEKSVAALANCNICKYKMQNDRVSSPTVSQNWRLYWGNVLKSGVILGLDHIYLLSLFDLHALHYGSLFGLAKDPTPGLGAPFFGK